VNRRWPLAALAAGATLAASLPGVSTAARAQTSAVLRTQRPVHRPIYLVGGASRSINPTKAMLRNRDFYLGGYGFGDDKIGNNLQIPGTHGRFATGILGDGAHSRALMISDRRHTIGFAQIETQGYFASYKQGPFGIEEIRHDAAARIAKLARHRRHHASVPTAAQILVDSDHTHGGADTVGAWGGDPTSYLREVHNRTVAALVRAWTRMRPARLTYGVAHAGVEGETKRYPSSVGNDPLLTNQFSSDPHNTVMDDEIRVIQARSPHAGRVLDTYVNYSAHPTVLGSDNRLVTGDYVGRVDRKIANRYGGFGMDQVGTLGRTQPSRADCTNRKKKGASASLCALDQYAARVMVEIRYAVRHARPVGGPATVGMSSYLIADPATQPALATADYAGALIGAPLSRTIGAPWFAANLIGTTVFSGHVGRILVSGGPGEMYPQIPQQVRRTVKRMQGYLSIGTAGDFLGYLIAPLSAYPDPVRRSVLSGAPPPYGDPACAVGKVSIGCPDPIGNDNFIFNVSFTMGMRITCALLRGAAQTLGKPANAYTAKDHSCGLFAADLRRAPGADTRFPEQPDRSATEPHM
jgi:hypothetical protein